MGGGFPFSREYQSPRFQSTAGRNPDSNPLNFNVLWSFKRENKSPSEWLFMLLEMLPWSKYWNSQMYEEKKQKKTLFFPSFFHFQASFKWYLYVTDPKQQQCERNVTCVLLWVTIVRIGWKKKGREGWWLHQTTSLLLCSVLRNYPVCKNLLASETCGNCTKTAGFSPLHLTTLVFKKKPHLSDASILGSSSYNVRASRLGEMTCCHCISWERRWGGKGGTRYK